MWFWEKFDNVYDNNKLEVEGKEKQQDCITDFLGLNLNILLIVTRLPKDKLKKPLEEIAKILEKKSSTT